MMKIGFTNRIILSAVILVISSLLCMALLTSFSVRRMLQDEIIHQLEMEANSFVRQVEKNRLTSGLVNREFLKKKLATETLEVKRTLKSNCAILVFQNDTLVSYYYYKPDSLPRDVLQQLATRLQNPQAFYEFSIQSEPYLCVIRPVEDVQYQTTVLPGIIISYASAASTLQFNDWMLRTLLLTAALAGAIAIAVGYLAARRIAKPLLLLQQQADRYAQRQFDTTAAIQTGDELEALSLSLGAMGASIREHDHKQREFFQNLSHELKTPLMSIQGYAEGLRDDLFDDPNEALEIIISESQQIKRQIEDITYLLKMDLLESFFNPKETSINELIAAAIRQIEGIALLQDIDIHYQPGEDRMLYVDGEKIITVLTNIFTNCLKYGHSCVNITTSVEDNTYIITACDDGNGLSEADLQHIFERFYKGTKSGTGLGMAISHQIATRHQGILEARNAPQGGAMFVLKLPMGNFKTNN